MVGIVYSDEEDEEEEVQYCPHCLKYSGVKNRLGARILEKGKPIPDDAELWKMCYVCGKTYALHEIAQDSQLKNTVETLDSPFESQTQLESIPKRTSPAGEKASAKRNRERNRPHHKDPEIDALMRIYGDRVNILMDSN